MVNIIVYGLDPFTVLDISNDLSKAVSNIYEMDEKEVFVVGSDHLYLHAGKEESSWNVYIQVHAPKKLEVLELNANDTIVNFLTTSQVAIHVYTEFYYVNEENAHLYVNPDYPRFIGNSVKVDADTASYSDDLKEGEADDEIYTGDIFNDIDK